mmetsp:Transcript_17647/g.35809  ORF Transcript_17647/g.35809 Transcript_17647/m.35809 type:complete len:110 (-) Transcript_17647:27-356(-)
MSCRHCTEETGRRRFCITTLPRGAEALAKRPLPACGIFEALTSVGSSHPWLGTLPQADSQGSDTPGDIVKSVKQAVTGQSEKRISLTSNPGLAIRHTESRSGMGCVRDA